ncbi:MAG: hypothetical protein VX090_12845 [Pseudomonadota bacterium]|nr:hypothetical protein [Pseudomonadota bacterium]
MRIATATREAQKFERKVHVNGQAYTLREDVGAMPLHGKYVDGNESNDNGMPQGFLVYQPPGSITPPHFHETNQFQVFVDGDGKMGKRAAGPLTVQYANGHTPYGPIEAGERGVRYFTLRQYWDPGAKYMPQSSGKLRKGNQRTRQKGNIPVGAQSTQSGVSREVVFPLESDGLTAEIYRVGADTQFEVPIESNCGGQYLVVASGEVVIDDGPLDRWSMIFVTSDEGTSEFLAGPEGTELLVLQFPTA